MPWRKRGLVIAAIASFVVVFAAGFALFHQGGAIAGVMVLAAAALAAVWALQAYWVRFDLPAPLGSWSSTFHSSYGTGVRRVLGRRAVALTFDDGPGVDTPLVLDALDRANARATFFVLGSAARDRPDLVREIARRGHEIGIHGDTHRKLHLALPGTVAREIHRGLDAIRAAGVEPSPLFRAPHGFKGPLLASALRRRGLLLVGWTRGVWDTEPQSARVIAERACHRIRGGEVLLLHDGSPPGSGRGRKGRTQTAAAIPEIVRRCRAVGLEFVTLKQLSPWKHQHVPRHQKVRSIPARSSLARSSPHQHGTTPRTRMPR